jgi:hypothetical protein
MKPKLTAAQLAKARAAANKKNPAPAPAPVDPPANRKPKATPSPAPAPIDGPRNPLNVPFSQRLNDAITKLLKDQGATDQDIAAQLAAADTILEKDALLRRLKNPQDADPISTPADLGPVPKKKGKGKGRGKGGKKDAPAAIDDDPDESPPMTAEEEAELERDINSMTREEFERFEAGDGRLPKRLSKGSKKGQSRAKDGKYNMPEGPLPEAVKPEKAAAKPATKKAKKPVAEENLDAEEEVAATPKKRSSLASYLPGYNDPLLAPVYGGLRMLHKYPVSLPVGGGIAAILAAQALSGFSKNPPPPAGPASAPPSGPPMGVGQVQQPPGGEFIPMLPPEEEEEQAPQREMAEGMEQDGERRFFFEKPANPAGGPTDIIRQYRPNR